MTIIIHRTTIQRWADYYMTLVDLYTKSLPVKTGGKWSVDEKYFKILGKGHWLSSVIDCHTRFLLAWSIDVKKNVTNAKKLLESALKRARCLPVIFCSDSLPAYRQACKKVFTKRRGQNVMHWCDCHIRGEFRNNNQHERANSTFGELVRTRRGPKSAESILITAALLHYNFLRPHNGIDDKTPAASAGIIIKGNSPLRTLIQNATLAT